jgi:hypothetical protein
MKARRIVKLAITFSGLCLMALHCGNPTLPKITLVTPVQNSVIVQDSVPYSLPVEVKVPVPGYGATTFPVDPTTFNALLTRLVDGTSVSETDVTSSFQSSQDPTTKEWTWTASLDFASFGDYQIKFTIQNSQGSGTNTLKFRLEQTVAAFPGGTEIMSMSSLKQTPSNCLLADALVSIIYAVIKNKAFTLDLPSGQDILDSGNAYFIFIPLPHPLENIDATLSLDLPNNDILITGPTSYSIDLTGFVPPPFTGFDCVITARANGVINDIDPTDLDGSLTIGILDVLPSPGGSGCTVNPPSGACSLIVGMDANPM